MICVTFFKSSFADSFIEFRSICFVVTTYSSEDYKEGFSFGLKSGKSPRQVKGLIQFEGDLVRTVKKLKFRKVKNNFQIELREDMKQVQNPADKTSNMYRLHKSNYQNLLRNAITRSYKKANKNIGTRINKEGIKFAKQAIYQTRLK